MFRNRLYYAIKPLLPWSVRMGVRRWFAVRTRKRVGGIWPILPGSERPPTGWPGWPDGKKFAFVLTHDVEGPEGLAKIKQLAELEMSLGFRSSFNLIPEGPYAVPAELRAWLVQNGFEVGVHDLHHDGKLFASRADFPAKAGRINTHLRNWNATGFRSGFMLRQHDWLHQLAIAYDATSFDTDPFEPQPEGINTIFPFWVPRPPPSPTGSSPEESPHPNSCLLSPTPPASAFAVSAFEQPPPPSTTSPSEFELRTLNFNSTGYAELPYTLPQDSTLFLLLREQSPEIWLRKLDWVAAHGGMALVNVHPDYLRFLGEPERPNTFPVEFYRKLLEHVRTRYLAAPSSGVASLDVGRSMLTSSCEADSSPGDPISRRAWEAHVRCSPQPAPSSAAPTATSDSESQLSAFAVSAFEQPPPSAWLALPRDVASFVLRHRATMPPPNLMTAETSPRKPGPIWIDLENTPHIPFFKPIARELEQRGYRVVFTARDAYQTCEMADRYGLAYTRIGRHYGKQKLAKVWGLLVRSHQLVPFVLREKPCLALNHGSRTQTYIANRFGIPTVTIMDYEFTAHHPFWRPLWEIVPSLMSSAVGHNVRKGGVRQYSGIKEDVYVPEFTPDASIRSELGLDGWKLVVTVRPPATEAHYHNPEAEVLFEHVMNHVHAAEGTKAVLLPRNKTQEAQIRAKWPQWFAAGRVVIPANVVNGLNLLWHSDVVVSGGGTMNREAAAMGVPVYSIFRGTIGAVDRQLVAEGRLVLIESADDVYRKITLQLRTKNPQAGFQPRKALGEIVGHIEDIIHNYG